MRGRNFNIFTDVVAEEFGEKNDDTLRHGMTRARSTFCSCLARGRGGGGGGGGGTLLYYVTTELG